MTTAEAARPAQNPDALDYVLRGRAALFKPISSENYAAALSSFEQAFELDPQSTDAQLGFAAILVDRVLDFGSSSAADDLKRAETLANQALAVTPRSAYANHLSRLIKHSARLTPQPGVREIRTLGPPR